MTPFLRAQQLRVVWCRRFLTQAPGLPFKPFRLIEMFQWCSIAIVYCHILSNSRHYWLLPRAKLLCGCCHDTFFQTKLSLGVYAGLARGGVAESLLPFAADFQTSLATPPCHGGPEWRTLKSRRTAPREDTQPQVHTAISKHKWSGAWGDSCLLHFRGMCYSTPIFAKFCRLSCCDLNHLQVSSNKKE